MDAAAYHGLAGEILRVLEPETEADPAAILFTLLAGVGNIAGRMVRSRVQDDEHPARLFVAVVGATSTGAKGTSWATVRPLLRATEENWFQDRVLNGFGSGEAVIAELAPQTSDPESEPKQVDPRLLVFDPEFARVLTVNQRDGSTQSMILRAAWDGGRLAVRRSRSRLVAPDSHLSIVGHITPEELRARLTETDCTSGFANRFLFTLSRRSKKLPSGGFVEPAIIGDFAKRLHKVTKARPRVLSRTAAADQLWDKLYLQEPERDGIVGALTARSHAQRLRLSVAYAILDGADVIGVDHLRAAEACWRYSVESIEHLFGATFGDDIADRVIEALRNSYPVGLDREDLRALFNRHVTAARLTAAIDRLERRGLAMRERVPSAGDDGRPGRPREVAYAVPRCAKSAESAVSIPARDLSAHSALIARSEQNDEVRL
jgi:hypothetical protein